MSTAVNLEFYDGGAEYTSQTSAYSAPPPMPAAPMGYSNPQLAFNAPTQFATPSYGGSYGNTQQPSTALLGAMDSGRSIPSSTADFEYDSDPPLLQGVCPQ